MTIKDALRRELATQQLQHSQRSILDVALALGFSETSAFYRAFKSWTGMLPGQYRQHYKQTDRARQQADTTPLVDALDPEVIVEARPGDAALIRGFRHPLRSSTVDKIKSTPCTPVAGP